MSYLDAPPPIREAPAVVVRMAQMRAGPFRNRAGAEALDALFGRSGCARLVERHGFTAIQVEAHWAATTGVILRGPEACSTDQQA